MRTTEAAYSELARARGSAATAAFGRDSKAGSGEGEFYCEGKTQVCPLEAVGLRKPGVADDKQVSYAIGWGAYLAFGGQILGKLQSSTKS